MTDIEKHRALVQHVAKTGPSDEWFSDRTWIGEEMPPLPPPRLHYQEVFLNPRRKEWRLDFPPSPLIIWQSVPERTSEHTYTQFLRDPQPMGVLTVRSSWLRRSPDHQCLVYGHQLNTGGRYEWYSPDQYADPYFTYSPTWGDTEAVAISSHENPKKGGVVIARVALKVCCAECQTVLPQSLVARHIMVLSFEQFLKSDRCPHCKSTNLAFDIRPPFPLRPLAWEHFNPKRGGEIDLTDERQLEWLCDPRRLLPGGFNPTPYKEPWTLSKIFRRSAQGITDGRGRGRFPELPPGSLE